MLASFGYRHVAVIQDSRKRSLNSLKSYMVSTLIALTAAIALFRFKRNVIEVIAACAVIGLILKTIL